MHTYIHTHYNCFITSWLTSALFHFCRFCDVQVSGQPSDEDDTQMGGGGGGKGR
jgi:hypothetical protein